MKTSPIVNDTFPSHSLDPFDEAAIRERTDRVGKQVEMRFQICWLRSSSRS